jgi:hypothetical protein
LQHEEQRQTAESAEDAAFLLYLAPVIAAIVYGVIEWVRFGPRSTSMPGVAYVVVSKDPFLFLGAIICVCAGFIIELRATAVDHRQSIISMNSTRMQILAISVLIISFAAGISAAGYDLAGGAGDFLLGRYALIFAFFLLGFSILLSPKQLIGNVKISVAPEFVGMLLMAASPFVFYAALKIHVPFSAAGTLGIIVLLIGVAVVFAGPRVFRRPPKTRQEKVAAATVPSV